MLSSHLYFELPSNTTLDVEGIYRLYVHNTHINSLTATLVSGSVEIKRVYDSDIQSYVEIDITKPNEEFEITISDNFGNSDTIVLNSGVSDYSLRTDETVYTVSHQIGVLEIPYTLKGYSPNLIEVICNKQTRVGNNTTFPSMTEEGGSYGTFDIDFPKLTKCDLVCGSDVLIDNDSYPPFMFYNMIYESGESTARINFKDVDDSAIYIGYSDESGVFIYNVENDVINRRILLYIAPNTYNRQRTQGVELRIGPISVLLEITQDGNPNGMLFDYDKDVKIPAVFTSVGSIYLLPLTLSNNLSFNISSITPNVNRVPNPYTVSASKYGSNTIRINSRTNVTDTDYLNKTQEQQIRIVVNVFDVEYGDDKYLSYTISKSYEASGMIYGSGEILVDSDNNISGVFKLDTNNATSVSYSNVPSWLNEDDLLFYNNQIVLSFIEPNYTEYSREADIVMTFTRPSGTAFLPINPYINTLTLHITQESSLYKDEWHLKAFEDNIFKSDDISVGRTLVVWKPDSVYEMRNGKFIFSGNVYGDVNISEFTTSLFNNIESPFDNSYTKLNLLDRLDVGGDGVSRHYYYTYDYSYDKENHFNITEDRQPIDYYDEKQYIFESVYNFPGAPIDIELNDRSYLNMIQWEKYNITLDAATNPSMQLKYTIGGIRRFGKLYKRKCTNAKYAVYYMNCYGGWNWMLFDGNKQIRKSTNKFYTFTNVNYENIPYSIETTTSYDLTSKYLTDIGSERLKDLYKSPMVYLHDFETNNIIRVNVKNKEYTEKTFINQGREFFTQSITVEENKIRKSY